MRVLDASVAAKWFLPEPGCEQAAELLQSSPAFVAPQLIRVEVNAAITRRLRLGELSEQRIRQACAEWQATLAQGVVKLVSDEELLEQAIDLSVQIRHSLQDCLYLALSVRRDIPLLTADPTFHDRARVTFPQVQLFAASQTL